MYKNHPVSLRLSTWLRAVSQVASMADVRYARWEVHRDWVVDLKYEDHLRSIISCSNDPSTGIVIGKSFYRQG